MCVYCWMPIDCNGGPCCDSIHLLNIRVVHVVQVLNVDLLALLVLR